ncbi:MAG: SRPBCC domain-containing protein [Bacteroidia bacterium]|nr:SRPBCC domain-containing protein [Bacteroidia bacterium]
MEYVIHSSAELLFTFLTEPSGLSEWFCDDVNIRHGIYTFLWDGSQQQAKELKIIPEKIARFQWVEKSDGSYFEFRIEKDDLTGDISLIITDFAENAEERNSSKLLWDSQIDKLLHVMGAYF